MTLNKVWENLVYSFKNGDKEFQSIIIEFKQVDPNWLDFLKGKMFSKERSVAFSVLTSLADDDLIKIFDVLVYHASFDNGGTKLFRNLIVKLPRKWVLDNIKEFTEPLLLTGDEHEYRRMLELYSELDIRLTNDLISRALASENSAIREAGDDFRTLLTGNA